MLYTLQLVHRKSYEQIRAEKLASKQASQVATNGDKKERVDSDQRGIRSMQHNQSVSSPPSSVNSSDNESSTAQCEERRIETPSVFIRKPSIATSDDSTDSRLNLSEYLSHRRHTDQAHSAIIKVYSAGLVDHCDTSNSELNESSECGAYKLGSTSPVTTPTHRRLEFEELHVPGDDTIDGESDSGLHSSIDCRSSSIPRSSSQGSFSFEHDVELRKGHSSSVSDSLDLNDIYYKLKRRSRSYESLLDAYTDEDPGLRSVLHTTLAELKRLSSSLDSLDSLSDDGFSCDVSAISLDISLSENNTLSNHQNWEQSHLSCTDSKAALNTEERHNENELCSTSEVLDQDKKDDIQIKHPVRRSKSCNNSRVAKKKFLKRRRNFVNKSSDSKKSHSKKHLEPHEALNKYQVASLGCSIGFETRTALRKLICDATPNTEKENYTLSVYRES